MSPTIAAIAPRPAADTKAAPNAAPPSDGASFGAALAAAQAHDAARPKPAIADDATPAHAAPLADDADASRPAADDANAASPHAVTSHEPSPTRAHRHAEPVTAAALDRASAALLVNRDLDSLADPFRARLDHVMSRMESLGYRVRVLETHRTQERQEQLFAQGRTAPGPVVTWTLNSNHAQGRAVDLNVTGGNGDGYEVLAKVAREVGLRTLGASDPGHIELPRASAGAEPLGRQAATGTGATTAPTPGVVAQVATVARVASVARVADVAVPGVVTPRVRAAGQDHEHADGATPADATSRPFSPSLAQADAASTTPAVTPPQAVTETGSTDIAGRIARVLQAQDALSARPASHVSLDVGDGEHAARIHVGLRGGELATRIDVSDPVMAMRLGHRIDELRNALQRHGLEPSTLQVRGLEQSRLDSLPTILRPEPVGLNTALPSDAATRRGPTGNDHNPNADPQSRHDPHRRQRRERPQEETT